ncbi:MAG: hypothetical protein LBI10_12730 [Deltaproteobacteria bacterium]|jgi:hypothetical protein|nr:hypothetical protein [Deltaproteobacteria bacterium]
MPEDLANSNAPTPSGENVPTNSPPAEANLDEAKEEPAPPIVVSQAVKDLNNNQAMPNPSESTKPQPIRPLISTIAWTLLYVLSLGIMALWAAFATIKDAPYFFQALVLTTVTLLVSIPTWRFLGLPQRATLAGIGLSLALTLTSLYNPEADIFPIFSFSSLWAFTTLLAWFAVLWTVWRIFGGHQLGLAILLTCALVYPFLGSGLSIIKAFFGLWSAGTAPSLTLANLNQSPTQITKVMPNFLWPQAIMAILIPLLAALAAFRTQLAQFLTKNASISLAPFFAGLAFLIIIVPGYLAFTPLSQDTTLAKNVRGLYPEADNYYSTSNVKAPLPVETTAQEASVPSATLTPSAGVTTPAETAPPSAESPQTPPSPASLSPADQTTGIEPSGAKTDQTTGSEPSETDLTKGSEPSATDLTTDSASTETKADPTSLTPVVATVNGPQTTGEPTQPSPDQPEAKTSPQGAETAITSATPASQETKEAGATPALTKDGQTPLAAKSAPKAPSDPAASTVLIKQEAPPTSDQALTDEEATREARSELFQRLNEENLALEKENDELDRQLALLKTENEFLRERLAFSDQIIHNLTFRGIASKE